MSKSLRRTAISVVASLLSCVALATTYTWTGNAGNGLLTDGGNWANGLPSDGAWSHVATIDGIASGTTLSLGADMAMPKFNVLNSPLLGIDLAGHKLSFRSDNNFTWNISDSEVTVSSSSGVGTNTCERAIVFGQNAKLTYDGIGYVKFRKPTFPSDKSAQIVFRNGTKARYGNEDNSVPNAYSRILVDNAELKWDNNFSRSGSSITKGWEIIAQNNGTVMGYNFCYLGSPDVSDPIRFVATSGATISMPSGNNRFYWMDGFEGYCTNATIQLNSDATAGYNTSYSRFVCNNGTMKGTINLKYNNSGEFTGTCPELPKIICQSDATNNVFVFTDATVAKMGSLSSVGRGTNNLFRINNSELHVDGQLKLLSGGATSPCTNSIIELSGKNAAIVTTKDSSGITIEIGDSSISTAAEDRPHLRFKIPEGGFADTPIRSENTYGKQMRWWWNPVIEVIPDGVRYGAMPMTYTLIGRGRTGNPSWRSDCTPNATGNMTALNTVSAPYLPNGATLIFSNNTVCVTLPARIELSAAYGSSGGTITATLNSSRSTDDAVHAVYGLTNGGDDPAAWDNDVVVNSFTVGSSSGNFEIADAAAVARFLRFYTVNGDDTMSWTAGFEMKDDPVATASVSAVGGNYASITVNVVSPGASAQSADAKIALAKVGDEYGEYTVFATGIVGGGSATWDTVGLEDETEYKYRVSVYNLGGEVVCDGTFTTGVAESGEFPVIDWTGEATADVACNVLLPYEVTWGGDRSSRADVHAEWWYADGTATNDVLLGAGVIGARTGRLPDMEPGRTYGCRLYATNAVYGKSEATSEKSVTTPGPASIDSAAAVSDASKFTLSGAVTPGLGETKVYLRWAFDSDLLANEECLATLGLGDGGAFNKQISAPQTGSCLHWQVVVSNYYTSTTLGEYAWGTETTVNKCILNDASAVDWTWIADGTNDWESAANWSALGKTGFPNASGAKAIFAPGGGEKTAELKDDVTLKEISVSDGVTTLLGNGKAMTLPTISYTGGNAAVPTLVFDNVKFAGNIAVPDFLSSGNPASLCLRNGTTVTAKERNYLAPGSRWRVSGAGTTLTFLNNAVRWTSSMTSDWEWFAEDGASIVGQGFMHVGSKDDTRDVKFTAINGGAITCGAGNNRTLWEFGGVVVAATNNGTVAFGAANTGTRDDASCYTCNSRFLVHNGNITGNINLASNNVVQATGDENGSNKFGTFNFASYSTGNRISIEGGYTTMGLGAFHGTGNEVLVREGAVVCGSELDFTGTTNCVIVLENAVFTNNYNAIAFDTQSGMKRSGFVFRGESPQLVITGNDKGVGGEIGSTSDIGSITYRFEPTGQGFSKAPFLIASANSRIREYIPIQVVPVKYRHAGRYAMPLIECKKGWKDGVPSAETIQSHLTEGALPPNAYLKWEGNVLCVSMPASGTTILTIR